LKQHAISSVLEPPIFPISFSLSFSCISRQINCVSTSVSSANWEFYISPNVYFTLDFVGAPAKSSLGFFVRGPHGTILPGAPIPPNYPT
jgi:hypothetical protein